MTDEENINSLKFFGMINQITNKDINSGKISRIILDNQSKVIKAINSKNKKGYFTRITLVDEKSCDTIYNLIKSHAKNIVKWKKRITIFYKLKTESESKKASKLFHKNVKNFLNNILKKDISLNDEIRIFLDKSCIHDDWDLLSVYKTWAIREQKMDYIKYFTERKIKSSMGLTELCSSWVKKEKNIEIAHYLIDSGLYDDKYLIKCCIETNQIKIVEKLLEIGIEVNYKLNSHMHDCIRHNRHEILKLLLNYGLEIGNVKKIIDERLEKKWGKEVTVLLIKSQKNKLYKKTKYLSWLIYNEYYDIASEFVSLGANINWLSHRKNFNLEGEKFVLKHKFIGACK